MFDFVGMDMLTTSYRDLYVYIFFTRGRKSQAKRTPRGIFFFASSSTIFPWQRGNIFNTLESVFDNNDRLYYTISLTLMDPTLKIPTKKWLFSSIRLIAYHPNLTTQLASVMSNISFSKSET